MIHDDDGCSWLWLKSQTLIQMMQPASKKLRAEEPEMTQSQASAPPRGPDEMRIASWNLGVPNSNSNMGDTKAATHVHYQSVCAKRKKNKIGPSCYSKRSIFWAQVAVELLGRAYVWND